MTFSITGTGPAEAFPSVDGVKLKPERIGTVLFVLEATEEPLVSDNGPKACSCNAEGDEISGVVRAPASFP